MPWILHSDKEGKRNKSDESSTNCANLKQVLEIPQVSVAGGYKDFKVPSRLCDMNGMTKNSLSVLFASVPGVGFAADHMSITWCKEFLNALTGALYTSSASLPASSEDIYQILYSHLSGEQPDSIRNQVELESGYTASEYLELAPGNLPFDWVVDVFRNYGIQCLFPYVVAVSIFMLRYYSDISVEDSTLSEDSNPDPQGINICWLAIIGSNPLTHLRVLFSDLWTRSVYLWIFCIYLAMPLFEGSGFLSNEYLAMLKGSRGFISEEVAISPPILVSVFLYFASSALVCAVLLGVSIVSLILGYVRHKVLFDPVVWSIVRKSYVAIILTPVMLYVDVLVRNSNIFKTDGFWGLLTTIEIMFILVIMLGTVFGILGMLAVFILAPGENYGSMIRIQDFQQVILMAYLPSITTLVGPVLDCIFNSVNILEVDSQVPVVMHSVYKGTINPISGSATLLENLLNRLSLNFSGSSVLLQRSTAEFFDVAIVPAMLFAPVLLHLYLMITHPVYPSSPKVLDSIAGNWCKIKEESKDSKCNDCADASLPKTEQSSEETNDESLVLVEYACTNDVFDENLQPISEDSREVVRFSDSVSVEKSYVVITGSGESVQVDTLKEVDIDQTHSEGGIPLFFNLDNAQRKGRYQRTVEQRIRSGKAVMPVAQTFRRLLVCLAVYTTVFGPVNLVNLQLSACSLAVLFVSFSASSNQTESYVTKIEYR